MTRYLSQALGASEPGFGQSIQELERASGLPSEDIRLSAEVMQRLRSKITALGLDPSDTTGPELYNALHERLRSDEHAIRQTMGIADAAPAHEVLARARQFLSAHEASGRCYALKSSVVKRMLKKKPPKAVMKTLGYRSVDSLLKHEPVAQILALAKLCESASWHRAYHAQYAKIQSADFESRPVAILSPQSQRWTKAASSHVAEAKHNIMYFKELGAIVLLPIESQVDGLVITSLLLSLHYLNDIRSYSSFAKLQQVRVDFGATIKSTLGSEPYTAARLAGQPVPWRMIQQYYGRFKHVYHPEVFEPHVQSEDLEWHHAEDVLASIAPQLSFWQGTQHICALHDGEPVSLNALDVALSYCNHLHFGDRIVHFVRDRLWHELMMRYLNQENLERAVTRQLTAELIPEQALAE